MSHTCQIGAWSSDSIPAILTIQTEKDTFRSVICELAVRLRASFILLGPTSSHLDVGCQELLSNSQGAFFPLTSHVVLTESGALRLRCLPGELFQQFTPQPKQQSNETTALQTFGFVKTLESKRRFKHPGPLIVFSLYCIDGLSISAIARKCECSRGTVLNRLKFIHRQTGADPVAMRRLYAGFEGVQAQLSDSRARYIHRKKLIDEADESDGE